MNLFEKIFNYQMMSRLDELGAMAITSQERLWLRTMLDHPEAEAAFEDDTITKLRRMLYEESGSSEPAYSSVPILEKASSEAVHIYHPLLRPFRRMIMRKSGIEITYTGKNGTASGKHAGIPYKLEYSMVKREWYLLWYSLHSRRLMNTKLRNIVDYAETALPEQVERGALARIAKQLIARRQHATIQVVSEYNRELSRILYAFSCFEKQVDYDDSTDSYSVRLTFLSDESEYVLSKIRFLGKRVIVTEGDYLRKRMLETTSRALARYERSEA